MKNKLHGILTLLLAFVVQFTFAQEKEVTGTVTDEQGLPLPGVNVIVQGTNNGDQTDFNGEFSINVSEGQVLEFSYVGFVTQEISVGSGSIYNVTLDVDSGALEEVVVVGYGTATKQSFTGSAKTVDSELLDRKNVADVSQALAGEAAGVRVINTSGQPGQEATIRIRGIGSVNGNRDPLYVLDGVPYNGTISAINPADIASTTILKDAAATAIYGARGANGVVVITTKKGRVGQSSISVETKLGTNVSLLPRYDVIDSPEQYIGLAWESIFNRARATGNENPTQFANQNLFSGNGISPTYNIWNVDGENLVNPDTRMVRDGVERRYTPEDWEDYGFQEAIRSETNLRISGGSDKSSYYASVGYLKDEGYIINSDFERFSGRLNLTHEVKDWLSGSMNIGYGYSETNNNGQSSDSGSIFWFVDNLPPIYGLFIRDENDVLLSDPIYGGNQYDYGEPRNGNGGRGFGLATNSIADATLGISNTLRHDVNTNFFLDMEFTDWLNLETRFGTQYYIENFDSKDDSFYGPSAGQNGSIYKEKEQLFSYNLLNLLRFQKDFDAHSVEALVAHEANSWEQSFMWASKADLADPDGRELNNAVDVTSPPGSYTNDYTLESYFAQVNYDFNDTYYFSGTIRRDGSSRFLEDKWGNFGSVGTAWVLSNENFMQDQGVFSFLKLKASYGLIGEQGGVGFYPGYDLYTVDPLDGNISLSFDSKGNRDLTWETSKQFQVGAEMSFGRFLDLDLAYYVKNTDDLLFERRVPPSLGYAIINVNDGQLRNTGLEFDVAAHLLKTEKAFIDLTVNGEIITNELTEMPIDPATGEPKLIDVQGRFGLGKGRSIYDFYIREYAGVNVETGQSQWNVYYNDANGDGAYQEGEGVSSLTEYLADNPDVSREDLGVATTTTYADATQKYVDKTAIPDVRGAFNLSAGWGDFTLGAQFLYSIGGYSYDPAYANLMQSNTNVGGNNFHTDILDRWQQPGDVTDVPRLSNDLDVNVVSTSTRFLTKADYLALNNVRLGYNVPKTAVESLGMNALNIYVSGDNLFLLSERDGFNPSTNEAGTSNQYRYSPLSTFTAGVRVNF
ncbi:SusC/RagA family TonB-linked outer membrane protein [Salegentibacter mishustinae]|uniref:SusC/RagA family TonB-linked outer membrane protein n=1 Tax=Salegentibacter mishustinae TaxID=270918 RepID=UPI001CE155A2|nr:SusC/RagA family TonB-linked outer membrane protein [Salegentibacter mishustinae]UBZ08524.1 SusC/RagA family TonB-linked outer membrane protein [Salegentibacter mishustinae]